MTPRHDATLRTTTLRLSPRHGPSPRVTTPRNTAHRFAALHATAQHVSPQRNAIVRFSFRFQRDATLRFAAPRCAPRDAAPLRAATPRCTARHPAPLLRTTRHGTPLRNATLFPPIATPHNTRRKS